MHNGNNNLLLNYDNNFKLYYFYIDMFDWRL